MGAASFRSVSRRDDSNEEAGRRHCRIYKDYLRAAAELLSVSF